MAEAENPKTALPSSTNGERRPTKTPMYEAMNAERYFRQALIRDIQKETGNQLICYVGGRGAAVSREDGIGIVELLHNIDLNSNIDLLLQTGGGDIDAAEKIVNLIRSSVGQARFRVIVPDYAKSAGTLIALAADKIVMSDSSELGPIDPQFQKRDADGILRWHSVLNYLKAYTDLTDKYRADPNDAATKLLLSKLDPTTANLFEAISARARTLAENHLNRWMFHQQGALYTKIASDLMDNTRWLAHGQVINWEDAKQIGLEIEYLSPKDKVWKLYWSLYCLQSLAIKDQGKLFEAAYASLPMRADSPPLVLLIAFASAISVKGMGDGLD